MKRKDFAAFILSHGRPDRVYTYETLIRHGFTGKIYIIIDNEDEAKAEYEKKFPGKVIVFDKKKTAEKVNTMDNFEGRRGVVFARNANFDIAEVLGIKYFWQLDDDYDRFAYKFTKEHDFVESPIKNLDRVVEAMIEFYKGAPITSLAMAQMGDFVGGITSGHVKNVKPMRKVINSFICSTDRRFEFVGRINEDVNTYVLHGITGSIFMTTGHVALNQKATQSNKGGLTEFYLDIGTYVKSFYTVMANPSAVKIAMVGDKHPRIHHQVSWKHAVPCILNESYKKTGRERSEFETPAMTLPKGKTTRENGKKRPQARK